MHENLENNNQYKNKVVSAFTVDNDEMFAKKSEYYEDMIYESFFTNSDKALAREFPN